MQKIILLTLCLVAISIQRINATDEASVEGPAVLEHSDQSFTDDNEREKRGDYKLVKIELEKVKDPKTGGKKSCSEMRNQLNVEIKKEFDLAKLSKASSDELLQKLQSLLDHLYHLKTDCEEKNEENKSVLCSGCKKGLYYEGNNYKSYHHDHEPKKHDNYKVVSHGHHYGEDDRSYDKHYYSHYYDDKPTKHGQNYYHEDKYSHKKPQYEATTEKSYHKKTEEPKTTTTEKPKYHKQDPYYERDYQKSQTYEEKKNYPQKHYPQGEETPKYDEKSQKHHEPYHYEKENKEFASKKTYHEEKPSYKPHFYEKYEPKKQLHYHQEKYPVHDKSSETHYVPDDPYYSKPREEKKYNFEESSYNQPRTTRKPHMEDHNYPKGDSYDHKPSYHYPEHVQEPTYKKPKTNDYSEKSLVKSNYEHEDLYYAHEEPYHKEKPHKSEKSYNFEEEKKEKPSHHYHEKSHVKSNYEPYQPHYEEKHYPTKYEEVKPHKKEYYPSDVHYEKPVYPKVSHEKPHYHPKPERTYEKEHDKYPFDVQYGDNDQYFRKSKEYTTKNQEPSKKPAATPKQTNYYEPHYNPDEDLVKYYPKSNSGNLHKKEQKYRSSCQKKNYQLPLAYNPTRYESLKRPDSPVHNTETLLKHLSGPDFYHFLPKTECKLHKEHEKPRKYAFTKSELYITKRKADGEEARVDKEDDVTEEKVPVWEDSAAVEGGNGEILSLVGDLKAAEEKISEKQKTPSYDSIVSKIKSEMEKIEQELLKRQGKINDQDDDDNDVNINYNPEADTVYATDEDIQQRQERSLFQQNEHKFQQIGAFDSLESKKVGEMAAQMKKRSVPSFFKKEKPKKDFLGDLFKKKKEQEKAKTLKSLFPNKKPSRNFHKGLFNKN